jgi:hypothetical protein
MFLSRRAASLLAVAVAASALCVTVPALAASKKATSTKNCFTTRVSGKKVLECLVAGPRGAQGPRGLQGPRGFTGPKGAGPQGQRGKTGAAGKTGKAGAAGKTGATGPQGPTGPAGSSGAVAYALVNPAQVSGTPSATGLVAAQTSGFATVSRAATGVYCLASASVSAGSVPATVSGESSYSGAGSVGLAVLDAQPGATCPSGSFEVKTYEASGATPAASNTVAFTIIAP